jgi:hypothetical protein
MIQPFPTTDAPLARFRSRSERTTLRIVNPPSACGPPPAGSLLNVFLSDDEDVEWIWTHYADGRSAVSGYRIVPRAKGALEQLLEKQP